LRESFFGWPLFTLSGNLNTAPMKYYWEAVADKLSKAGWSWGCVSAIDSKGRTMWIADAHRDDERVLPQTRINILFRDCFSRFFTLGLPGARSPAA
jgi:hypothetical protein